MVIELRAVFSIVALRAAIMGLGVIGRHVRLRPLGMSQRRSMATFATNRNLLRRFDYIHKSARKTVAGGMTLLAISIDFSPLLF